MSFTFPLASSASLAMAVQGHTPGNSAWLDQWVSGSNPYSFIAAQSASNSSANSGCTTPAMNTSGATLLVASVVDVNANGILSLTDSAGNTWTGLTTFHDVSGRTIQVGYVFNPVTSSNHTFSVNTTPQFAAVSVLAFSGGPVKSFDAQSAGSNGTSASPSGGSITPAQNNELILAAVLSEAPAISSIDSSFTIPANAIGAPTPSASYGTALAYLIQGSAAAVNPTWTLGSSGNWVAGNVAFK